MSRISFRLIALIACSIPLAGCFVSDKPLFDTSEAVRQVPIGIWRIEDPKEPPERRNLEAVIDYKDGHYIYYRLDQRESVPFDLIPLSNRSWVVQIRDRDGAVYGVLETKIDHYEYYEADCAAFQSDPAFQIYRPEVASGGYSSNCKFADKDKLRFALLSTPDGKRPTANFTFDRKPDVFPLPNAEPAVVPKPEEKVAQNIAPRESSTAPTPADKRNPESKLFTLTLCNKSDAPADAIFFHKHIYDEKKWVLNGWRNMGAGKCIDLRIPRGYFYIAATNSKGLVWSGTDRYICTSSRAVERTVFENERCLTGEINRGFFEVFNTSDAYTHNLTQ